MKCVKRGEKGTFYKAVYKNELIFIKEGEINYEKNYEALALLIAVLLSSTTVGCSATVKENEKKDGYQIEIKNEEDIQTNDIEINIEKK